MNLQNQDELLQHLENAKQIAEPFYLRSRLDEEKTRQAFEKILDEIQTN